MDIRKGAQGAYMWQRRNWQGYKDIGATISHVWIGFAKIQQDYTARLDRENQRIAEASNPGERDISLKNDLQFEERIDMGATANRGTRRGSSGDDPRDRESVKKLNTEGTMYEWWESMTKSAEFGKEDTIMEEEYKDTKGR